MVKEVGPGGPGSAGYSLPSGSPSEMPPGPPLPADDPWVKGLAVLFPNVPLGELMMYASKFRDNMFQALNSEISRDLKKARKTARKFKESINE
jgi:hypothetical protein